MNTTTLQYLASRYGRLDLTDADFAHALMLAEARIGRDLQSSWNDNEADIAQTVTMSSTGRAISVVQLPGDYRRPIGVFDAVSGAEWIVCGYEQVAQWEAGLSGKRWAYFGRRETLLTGLTATLMPATTDGAKARLFYYRQPPPLTASDAPADHPATVFPDVYVHGVLQEVARLSGDPGRLEAAVGDYAAALDLANALKSQIARHELGQPATVIGGSI